MLRMLTMKKKKVHRSFGNNFTPLYFIGKLYYFIIPSLFFSNLEFPYFQTMKIYSSLI